MSTSQLKLMATSCGLLSSLVTAPMVHAQVVAGTLEIDLNAAGYAGGNWSNSGALGGLFTAQGTPQPLNLYGVPAVLFDGSDAFRGPVIPASMTGAGTRTIEVWAYQGWARGEETLVAWGRRGGGDSTNESFNWGADREWGAHGGWGANADLGWNQVPGNNPGSARDTTNMPTIGSWHHLVYTYDGSTMSVYDNGVLKNSQAVALNTHAGYEAVIGSQNGNVAAPGVTSPDYIHFSGAIANVRVHSGALSGADVLNNYNLGVGTYGLNQSAQLTAGPAHRYTFDNLASGAAGTTVPDVVGGNNAVIRGSGATVTATGVDLPGGSPASAAYIDLPNGLLSSRTNVTLEGWVTVQSTQNWSRLIDIGTSTAGEVTDVGTGFNGGTTDWIMVSASNGTGVDQQIERNAGTYPAGVISAAGDQEFRGTQSSTILGTQQHFALTYDSTTQEWKYFRDGKLMEVLPELEGLAMPDHNAWLGRSQFDGDFNLDGLYDEFRVYDQALSPAQIYGNFLAGPDVVNLIPEPATITLAGAAGLLLLRRRRR